MSKEFLAGQSPEQPEAPSQKKPSLMEFHEKAKAAGAYEKPDKNGQKISERLQALMEAYCTTPASYKDLRSLAGGVGKERVHQLIQRGLAEVWLRLPPELQEEYSVTKEDPVTKSVWRSRMLLRDFDKPGKHKQHT